MTGNFARGTGCCGVTSCRLRLVLADRRRLELRLAPFGRPRPDLSGRLLRDDDGERPRQQRAADEQRFISNQKSKYEKDRSEP